MKTIPSVPYLISGITKNSFGDNLSDVAIIFTISGNSDSITSNSYGKYLIDLTNIGYSQGDTVTYSAIDAHSNEIYSGSFVISGTEKELDISLSVRSDRILGDGNRDVTITNIGGDSVSSDNPFPVRTSSIPLGKGNFALSYDSNSNLTKVVNVIGSDTYTLTLSYNSSNNLTKVSDWVRT